MGSIGWTYTSGLAVSHRVGETRNVVGVTEENTGLHLSQRGVAEGNRTALTADSVVEDLAALFASQLLRRPNLHPLRGSRLRKAKPTCE